MFKKKIEATVDVDGPCCAAERGLSKLGLQHKNTSKRKNSTSNNNNNNNSLVYALVAHHHIKLQIQGI